jgi:hypothetical protein
MAGTLPPESGSRTSLQGDEASLGGGEPARLEVETAQVTLEVDVEPHSRRPAVGPDPRGSTRVNGQGVGGCRSRLR